MLNKLLFLISLLLFVSCSVGQNVEDLPYTFFVVEKNWQSKDLLYTIGYDDRGNMESMRQYIFSIDGTGALRELYSFERQCQITQYYVIDNFLFLVCHEDDKVILRKYNGSTIEFESDLYLTKALNYNYLFIRNNIIEIYSTFTDKLYIHYFNMNGDLLKKEEIFSVNKSIDAVTYSENLLVLFSMEKGSLFLYKYMNQNLILFKSYVIGQSFDDSILKIIELNGLLHVLYENKIIRIDIKTWQEEIFELEGIDIVSDVILDKRSNYVITGLEKHKKMLSYKLMEMSNSGEYHYLLSLGNVRTVFPASYIFEKENGYCIFASGGLIRSDRKNSVSWHIDLSEIDK